VHDAVSAERLGTPAVAVVTSGFVTGAATMAAALGAAGYRFAVVEHPIASATGDELAAKAASALDQAAPLVAL
jgi:hypothetical protein